MNVAEQQLLDTIKSRGYWRVVVRPSVYPERRLSRHDLELIIVRSRVSLRGWDFPHVSQREPIRRFKDGIAQGTDWEHYREYWRFYQSGQFIYLGGIANDWRDESGLWPGRYDLSNREMGFISTIYRFTEIFEFAARLAVTEVGTPDMHVGVELHGMDGRRFYMDDTSRVPFHERSPISVGEWEGVWKGSRDELVSRRGQLAIEMLQDLFDLWGLVIQEEVIEYHQQRLIEGSP